MILWWIIAFLIGAIPFAKVFDSTQKELTASNYWKRYGALTGIVVGGTDMFKGVIAVGVPTLLGFPAYAILISGVLAVWGQIFNPFNKFKGGGGLMTTYGVLTIYNPLLSHITPLIVIPALINNKVKDGIIISYSLSAFLTVAMGDIKYLWLGTAHTLLIIVGYIIKRYG